LQVGDCWGPRCPLDLCRRPRQYRHAVRCCVSLTVACFACSSPAFLDKITVHIAKNFLELPKIKVPLILGIWGGKGQGKTFQCTLAYKKLGINPVVMSAGELESGNAGEPAKLIRQRYRSAPGQTT